MNSAGSSSFDTPLKQLLSIQFHNGQHDSVGKQRVASDAKISYLFDRMNSEGILAPRNPTDGGALDFLYFLWSENRIWDHRLSLNGEFVRVLRATKFPFYFY